MTLWRTFRRRKNGDRSLPIEIVKDDEPVIDFGTEIRGVASIRRELNVLI